MSNTDTPLVSCICISGNMVGLLQRSIDCFIHQTYPTKELIIAYSSDNRETAFFLRDIKDQRIIFLEIPVEDGLTLGEKRNLAIEKSNGFYFCVWDDDDWYNNFRIEFQVQSLRNTVFKSSVLERVLVYDSLHEEAYLSGTRWAWEQTLLCEKSVMKNPALRYASLEKGEDSILIFNLREHELLNSVMNSKLYIYVYHGKNTWHREHWEQNILAFGSKMSAEKSEMIARILHAKYSHEEASLLLENIFKN